MLRLSSAPLKRLEARCERFKRCLKWLHDLRWCLLLGKAFDEHGEALAEVIQHLTKTTTFVLGLAFRCFRGSALGCGLCWCCHWSGHVFS